LLDMKTKHCKVYLKLMKSIPEENRPDFVNDYFSSPSLFKQRRLDNVVTPKMTNLQQEDYEKNMAMHFFITGTPFSRCEDKSLWIAQKILNPSVIPFNRRRLAGQFLCDAYNRLEAEVNVYLNDPMVRICLTTDAWSNVNKDPIVNYMGITDIKEFFLESVATEGQSHNSTWIAQDMLHCLMSSQIKQYTYF